MISSKLNQEEFIFSTISNVNAAGPHDEFILELFDYSPNLSCDGTPKKVIKNFDELIEFFETID